jgi:hypothetical protein
MGQIVIETPTPGYRFYRIESEDAASKVIAEIEEAADRLENLSDLSIELLEDIEDIIVAREAIKEAEQTGTKSWEEVKAELNS